MLPTSQARLTKLFLRELRLCAVKRGEIVAMLTNLSTRREYVAACHEAAGELGAFAFELGIGTLPDASRVAADGLSGADGVFGTLKQAQLLVTFHAPNFSRWARELRAGGTRILAILDGPQELERLMSPPGLKEAVLAAAARWQAAKEITLLNKAGTHLTWRRGEFNVKSQYGFAEERGRVDHWGAGHITNYPDEGTANGTVVVQPGDLWILPFARVVESEIRLEVRDGFIRKVEGGADAKAFTHWLDRNRLSENDLDPYAVSHLGFGLHPNCHRDYIFHVGAELERLTAAARVFAGNFLFSTGPNTEGGGKRATKGHIDMPMCDCTVLLDGKPILVDGKFHDAELIVEPTWRG
jgi:2,5-dihydroxypyridine 5,6-dioxygenase